MHESLSDCSQLTIFQMNISFLMRDDLLTIPGIECERKEVHLYKRYAQQT